MKYVWKSIWSTNAKWLLLLKLVFMSGVIYVDALIVRWINAAVTAPSDKYMHYIFLIGAGYALSAFMDFMDTRCRIFKFYISEHMQNEFAEKLLTSDIKLFEKFSQGEIRHVQSSTGDAVSTVMDMMSFVQAAILLIVNWIMIFMINKKDACIIGAILIAIVVGFTSMRKFYRKYADERNAIRKKASGEYDDVSNGFLEVRSFNKEIHGHLSRLKKCHAEVREISQKVLTIQGCISIIFDIGTCSTTLVILVFGILAIQSGNVGSTTAGIIAMIMYVWKLIDPAAQLTFIMADIQEEMPRIKDYEKLMDYENSLKDGNIIMDDFVNEISLKDVSFTYDTSSKVIRNLNMNIKKGEHIGICGKSGGGKTTLLKLLFRLYDVTEGAIEIDGINIKDLTLESLHSKIAMVSQTPFIFDGSIRKNITYGTVGYIPEEKIIEACRKAAIWDFIESTPNNLETEVGSRGMKLSGGQRQRISLARIFLINPDILILDEATSALDNETETYIQEALAMFNDKTTITVAHRLSTIQDCDCIYVMDNNGIAEFGTHEELIEAKGIYYSLRK